MSAFRRALAKTSLKQLYGSKLKVAMVNVAAEIMVMALNQIARNAISNYFPVKNKTNKTVEARKLCMVSLDVFISHIRAQLAQIASR